MGSWFSKNDNRETENLGVSQNVVISNEEPINFHNHEILLILYVLAAIKVFEIIYYVVRNYKNELKEKFSKNNHV
jgi:hypothetical protein